MSKIVRFGVSIEEDLIRKFDTIISERGYDNRSEAIRDLIRDFLIKEKDLKNQIIAGIITIVYDHHKGDLIKILTDLQHNYLDYIISTVHIHIDHNNCLEVIILKGPSNNIKSLKDRLSVIKGIKHCNLVITSLGDV